MTIEGVPTDAVIQWVIIAAIVIGIMLKLHNILWPVIRAIERMAGEWEGRPARPGVPAQPGVMERLSILEQVVSELNNKIVAYDPQFDNGDESEYRS